MVAFSKKSSCESKGKVAPKEKIAKSLFVKEPVSEKLFQELKGKFKFVPIRMTGKFPHTDQPTFGLIKASCRSLKKEKDTIINDDERLQLIQRKNDKSAESCFLLLQSIRVIKYEMCKNKF